MVASGRRGTNLLQAADTKDAEDKTANVSTCSKLPKYAELKAAIEKATADETSGLNNHMWATIVDRDGIVCAVAFSGVNRGAQWPGSRVISAQKANTANAFSLDPSSSSNGSGQAAGLAFPLPIFIQLYSREAVSTACKPAIR